MKISLALGRATVFAALSIAGVDAIGRQDPQPPRILLDQSLRAVEYQLSRLTDDELVLVERRDDDLRYRPVYFALLTRSVARSVRDEALAALVKMDRTSPPRVLLEALGKVPEDRAPAADRLVDLLVAQPAATLRPDRDAMAAAAKDSAAPFVWRGAYGGLMIADGTPEAAWKAAETAGDRHLVELLRSVPRLPAGALGVQLFTPIALLARESADPALRTEALGVLGWTRPDTVTFALLAGEIGAPGASSTDATRAAAVRSLLQIPVAVWPTPGTEPLVRAIVAFLGGIAPDQRTEPAAIEALQLGEKLAATLPAERAREVRRELRALGVQVVRIQTLREQMRFDLNWFVVEAGKAVQVVLTNTDTMPHNLVVGQPGSLQEIGTAGAAVPMPTDPEAKPFVPDTPLVLQATNQLREGETARLGFTAPAAPGEYVFACTFPGHWIRMYGVMLVVPSMDAWEARPTPPTDPITKQPFASQRNAEIGQ